MPRFSLSDRRDLSRAWQAVLGRLEMEVSSHEFETWLQDTRPLHLDGDVVVIEARTAFTCDWLNDRLLPVVERALRSIAGEELRASFVPSADEAESDHWAPGRARSVVGSLNCAYTFERYLAAEGNRLALECCSALVGGEDFCISPVVVYGPPGMGKTHLLHAVASRAADDRWPVACLNAEEFTTRYMVALRRGGMEEFQAVLRGVRLLVIDDLQYLAGKKGTQDELVHTIDAVVNGGGHVVVASERHPADLDLPERLASRLAAGIVARIEPFVLPERSAYIERLARDLRASLPPWAAERIAGIEAPSVRVLQGAVHAAAALLRLERLDERRLDLELMRLATAEAAPPGGPDRPLVEAVARHFATTFDELAGRSRKPPLGEARAVAVAALKERGRSLSQIASLLGGRDRSTISQLGERGRDLLSKEPSLRALLAG